MRTLFHETVWEDVYFFRIKQSFSILLFLRPSSRRSVKHARKYRHLKIQDHPCAVFLPVSLLKTSGERYYPHTGTGHPSANWYNWKESHSGQFIFCISCSFCCYSESDTFLKNFITIQTFGVFRLTSGYLMPKQASETEYCL